jgi:Holliday junction resolvase RusA-like endonuclease
LAPVPRRNQRVEPDELPPIQITVTRQRDYRQWLSDTEFQRCKEAGEQRWRKAEEKQRKARIEGNLDWSVCLVIGCEHPVLLRRGFFLTPPDPDPMCEIPLCHDHLTIAWRQMQQMSGTPEAIESVETLNRKVRERDELQAAEEKKRYLASREGEIYFLRQNGLIKVGWSRCLYDRLRSYGPNVELLVHYNASRDDETNLHRQLRPALAKGREWYEDGQIVDMFVRQAIKKHGLPTMVVDWTQPKAIIKQRQRR